MWNKFYFYGKYAVGGLISYATPRFLVALGLPIDRWIMTGANWFSLAISNEAALWGVSTVIFFGLFVTLIILDRRHRSPDKLKFKSAQWVPPKRVEVVSPPAVDAPKRTVQLPTYEIERKLKVIDEVLAILIDEMQESIEQGTRLLNSWWNAFKNPEIHPDYMGELLKHRDGLKDQVRRIDLIREKNSQYQDISAIAQPVFWNSAFPKIEQFLVNYQELSTYFRPDVSYEVFYGQMKQHQQAMEVGIRELTSWRNNTRGNLNDLRIALTT